MEQRMTLITLGVKDLSHSVAFYERLGWERSVRKAEGVAFFQAGGIVLSLYPRDALAKDADMPPEGSGFSGFSLAYNTRTRDEVDAVLAEAVPAGGTLVKPAYEIFWGGYVGFFADPDGFLWEVAWNPMFPLTEDGAIVLPE
ncbi:MAG: VOC family protein [Alphaproteobacteria bacterium]|nr:VOC family protein [Alphaproteobacteria bacterium]